MNELMRNLFGRRNNRATAAAICCALMVTAASQITLAETVEEQAAADDPQATAPQAVGEAVEAGAEQADDRRGAAHAIQSVDQAYDAAVLRTDIELDRQLEERGKDLDGHRISTSLDVAQLDRMRAFFEDLDDEEAPAPLVRLRNVGKHLTDADSTYRLLQPHVPDPRWDEAMEMLVDDDCDDALRLATEILGPPELHADGEPAIAYAFARIQMCSDRGNQRSAGRSTMQQLAGLSSPVGHLARTRLGLSNSADIDDNAQSIGAHISDAKRLAENGEVDEALVRLAEFRATLDGGWNRHRVRLAEAEILEDAGRYDEAVMAYRGVYRKTWSWRSSDRITASIEDAAGRMDREIITFDDRVDRMRALIARGRYRQARAVSRENAQIRGVSGSEVRGWTRYRQALQNERQRNRERAARQFEEANDLVEDEAIRPRLYFGWARALRRTGGDTEAIELYDRICREYPAHTLCDRALYEAGRLLQYQNHHEEARERFSALVGLHPFSEHVPDGLWRYSLSAYLQDDFEDAIPPLKQIVDHHGEIQDASELTIGLKARYWLGVNHLKLGDDHNARRWLQSAVDHGPLTWYGRLAVTRLEQEQMPVRISNPTKKLSKDEIEDFATLRIPDHPRLAAAAELTRLGLYDDALREVRSQLDVHPTPEGAVSLRAALHLAVDEPNWAHWIMKSVIEENGPSHRTLRDWGFAFPLNYFDLSHRYGSEYGVSPHLVQAIMRQESGFRPTVSSHAGAMGLMQLMPGTARYTARRFFENQRLSNRQILNEATNVRLGTMYIRIHHAHASDHTPLALAGYNAGPAPLTSWFERYGDREVDAWVESITYRETRGYVRKVMTSYITYQGLYGDDDPPHIELQLPDELGEWGVVPEAEEMEEGEPVSMIFN